MYTRLVLSSLLLDYWPFSRDISCKTSMCDFLSDLSLKIAGLPLVHNYFLKDKWKVKSYEYASMKGREASHRNEKNQ